MDRYFENFPRLRWRCRRTPRRSRWRRPTSTRQSLQNALPAEPQNVPGSRLVALTKLQAAELAGLRDRLPGHPARDRRAGRRNSMTAIMEKRAPKPTYNDRQWAITKVLCGMAEGTAKRCFGSNQGTGSVGERIHPASDSWLFARRRPRLKGQVLAGAWKPSPATSP